MTEDNLKRINRMGRSELIREIVKYIAEVSVLRTENERLREKLATYNSALSQALNEGNGTYKP